MAEDTCWQGLKKQKVTWQVQNIAEHYKKSITESLGVKGGI